MSLIILVLELYVSGQLPGQDVVRWWSERGRDVAETWLRRGQVVVRAWQRHVPVREAFYSKKRE